MTTIAYDRPVKDYIDELNATGHVTHIAYKKTSVTLHHNAGRLSHEGVLNVWKTRPASAHFDVDGLGAVAQYVKVNEYAWAAGDTEGNRSSIHIEMANSSLSPDWMIADATWKSAARLAGWLFAKVVGSRPSSSNFFQHEYWVATACAGPYTDKVWSKIMAEAQVAYDHFKGVSTPKPRIPGSIYTGSKIVKVSKVRPDARSESVQNFNGLLWAWLCTNNPSYARNNLTKWMSEPANLYGLQAQRATQEMYRILASRDATKFEKVTLPTWPGWDGVRAIGGQPV